MRRERVNCWWMSFVCSFFCLYDSDRVQWVLCLISMMHSMMLLLRLQCSLLLLRKEEKRANCWLMSFVCLLFFCVHHSNRVRWVLCLIPMIHSMMMLLFLQCCCLLMRIEGERVNCWWMSFVCLLSFVFTTQIECSECCIWFQWFTQWWCSFSNVISCCWENKRKEWIVD